MKSYRNNKAFVILILVLILPVLACKKLLEVDPPINQYTSETVYSNSTTAIAAMTGIYANILTNSYASDVNSISLDCSLMADELICINSFLIERWQNEDYYLMAEQKWNHSYLNMIYQSNSIIEGVVNSTTIPEKTKTILIGEAKFTRAFTYFYLVNLFGDVPLVTSTDLNLNLSIGRTDKAVVYQQIVRDLQAAQTALSEYYLGKDLFSRTEERVRPNKFAATALLARVYLYLGMWAEAESESSKLIDNKPFFELVNLDDKFLKSSKEAIWQVQPSPSLNAGVSTNVPFARLIIPYPGATPNFSLSSFLVNAFEAGDDRFDKWVKTTEPDGNGQSYLIPNKYKVGSNFSGGIQGQSEYLVVFRLAEQYLIRAEARTMLGKLEEAKSDLNSIRQRAGLTPYMDNNLEKLKTAIEHERQVELFTEWGDRWFDLKRKNKLDQVMETVTPTKIHFSNSISPRWANYKSLLPIPQTEFENNASLRGHQNPGYQETK